MTTKLKTYGIMIIAAVLLVAMAFAGAASAEYNPINAEVWEGLDADQINANATYNFTGAGTIQPKFIGETAFNPTQDLTFDFTDFHGTFAGVQSGSMNYQGALFGKIENTSYSGTITIKNLTLTSVNVTPTVSKSYYGGIVGYFKGKGKTESMLNFTNCTLVNCSIGSLSGSDCVGGLVGYANSASVNIEDCSVKSCDVVSGSAYVGGLVGRADSASFVRGNVTNSTVASSGSYCVGGLVGYAISASFESCGVENASVYAGSDSVGGLVGYAYSAITKIDGCIVKNCVVASGSYRVGGLVGYANSASNVGNCHVLNCTIAGSYNVGGLVGYASSASFVAGDLNSIEYCAVNGTGSSNIQLVCGNGKNLNCTADLGTNFIYNNSLTSGTKYADIITLYNITTDGVKQPITSLNKGVVGTTFWKTIYNTTGCKSGCSNTQQVTYLGKYGEEGGYGVGSAPKYCVTIGDVQNGTLTPSLYSAVEGTSITVTATPDSGYYAVNWTYYNKTNDPDSPKVQFPQVFLMPAYDVTIGGDFKANVTNVTFYNLTVPIESKLNTYNNATNTTPAAPTRVGYMFAGWNISAENGLPFNGTSYNESGIWKYTGPHYVGGAEGILNVYANWTANTYNVTFNNNTGSGTMENQTFSYDEQKALSANLFTKSGYTFAGWNKTSASGTTVDFADKASVKNLTNVNNGDVDLYAVWTQNPTPAPSYSSSSSKQIGYTVILPEEVDARAVNSTVVSTQNPVTPTVIATPKPTTTPKTPAPFIGLLAGLGAAALFLRLRK